MTEERFTGIINRAQKLITDDNFNRMVESRAASMRNGGSTQTMDTKLLEEQAFGYSSNKLDNTQLDIIRNRGTEGANAVLENAAISEQSVLGKFTQANLPTYTPNATVTPQATSGVDYSLIKTLIDESISRHLTEFKEKGLLSENTNSNQLRGVILGEGNRIQFLDKKGNLYEATLKLKKKKA